MARSQHPDGTLPTRIILLYRWAARKLCNAKDRRESLKMGVATCRLTEMHRKDEMLLEENHQIKGLEHVICSRPRERPFNHISQLNCSTPFPWFMSPSTSVPDPKSNCYTTIGQIRSTSEWGKKVMSTTCTRVISMV